MSTRTRLHLIVSAAVFTLIGPSAFARTPDSQPAGSRQSAKSGSKEKYTLSGPHTHENLTLYLVHGADNLPDRKFLTLEEALEQKKAVVHETGNVNLLAIENQTEDEEIFVQAGDIVRGGQQDRVLGQDVLVPPDSGRVPLQSFCVELGRWSPRGAEPASHFASSENVASSNALKLAIRLEKNQERVWKQVNETQARLSHNVGTMVNSPASPNSLPLALENSNLEEKKKPYVGELTGAIEGKDDVVGLVVVLNRRIYSADMYASPQLFKKLWPRLLDAGVTEAIGSLNGRYALHKPTSKAVEEFLATDAEPLRAMDVLDRFRIIETVTKDKVIFELEDKNNPGPSIHTSIVPVGR